MKTGGEKERKGIWFARYFLLLLFVVVVVVVDPYNEFPIVSIDFSRLPGDNLTHPKDLYTICVQTQKPQAHFKLSRNTGRQSSFANHTICR